MSLFGDDKKDDFFNRRIDPFFKSTRGDKDLKTLYNENDEENLDDDFDEDDSFDNEDYKEASNEDDEEEPCEEDEKDELFNFVVETINGKEIIVGNNFYIANEDNNDVLLIFEDSDMEKCKKAFNLRHVISWYIQDGTYLDTEDLN